MIRAAVALVFLFAGPAAALEFSLPATARQTVERDTAPDVYDGPVGVFADGSVPVITVEGPVRRSAWRLNSPGLTPFQVMRPLRDQLSEAGYEIALDCRAETCGGFDFRFATETLPGPNLYVNIRAFQFVTGLRRKGTEVVEVITLLTSTSATSAYVQIIQAGEVSAAPATATADAPRLVSNDRDVGKGVTAQLLSAGHAILPDLDFSSGTTDLGPGPFTSLTQLAAFLSARPDMRIALVGHTDTVGGLETNISISRARARAVRQRLIESYGIDGGRLDAEGMGYLAPVANNLDAEGRESNRRVEVVLLGTG